jgi:tetratricopeptide (TPR) repeat protein
MWRARSTGEVWKHFAMIGLLCALSGTAMFVVPRTVSAQSEYDVLIEQASDAYRTKRFEQARESFERAHALQPSARTLRGLGVTAFALDRYAQARPELEAALSDPRKPLPADQRREVSDILAWMKQSLGTLRLQLSPADASARVDDRPVSAGLHLFELGPHELIARAHGYATRETRFVLEPGAPLELRIELNPEDLAPIAVAAPVEPPTAATEPSTAATNPFTPEAPGPTDSRPKSVFSRWWFWTIVGIVVAGTVVTAVVATREPDPRALPQGVRLPTP